MKGMELAKAYYEKYGAGMIESVCSKADAEKIAVGLVGEGSQCFGFDDEISTDHDFGPGFCIWLNEELYGRIGWLLSQAYSKLPSEFQGFSTANIQDKSRVGVMSICGFYRKYTGLETIPQTNRQWLFLRETDLAVCTNGKVFTEGNGKFMEYRQALLNYYPEDVLRKKIAARCAVMSQAGQYNLLRCLKREDGPAAILAVGKFTEAALSLVYLLNRKYMPFYKWAFHGLKKLDRLTETAADFQKLPYIFDDVQECGWKKAYDNAFELTEKICTESLSELNKQGFTSGSDPFLQNHLGQIMSGIKDEEIRKLPPIFDYGL